MDDKAYTCFYCHSILPYDVCISGTHFCLQATNAIEFWGNVVKIASSNSVDQENDGTTEQTFKVEEEEAQMEAEVEEVMEENEEPVIFSEIQAEANTHQNKPVEKSTEDSQVESHESDTVKPMNWKLKMIALVKQRPPLYDKRLPLSERTFPIRAKLWKEVYEGLNGLVPIEILPKRFKVLRDRYNKEIKKLKMGYTMRKPWSLLKYLTFLSSTKKNSCVKKMNLANGEYKLEVDDYEKNVMDEDSYKENLEIKMKFVRLVGERPPLYDCRLPRATRVAENKVKLWQEVYDSLDGAIPLVDLPRKFKSLRDRYMKEKKKSCNNEPPTWKLMEHMTFLDDVAYIRSQDNFLEDFTNDKRKKSEEKKPLDNGECVASVPSLSPLRNVLSDGASSQNGDESSIILQDDGETNRGSSDKACDSPTIDAVLLKHSLLNNSSIRSQAPANIKLKKLELLDTYDSWNEDDFFGAYLVRLMKRIPIEEKLRLHMEIISMIRKCLDCPK